MDGWFCTELPDVDITKPLQWPDESAEYLYLSHVLEHVSCADAMRFLKEAYRILAPGGKLRIVVPEIAFYMNRPHVQDLCEGHGHMQTFSYSNLQAMIYGAGFDAAKVRETGRMEIDAHSQTIGEEKDLIESLRVEAIK